MTCQPYIRIREIVLWQVILLAVLAPVYAQQSSSVKADSIHGTVDSIRKVAFPKASSDIFAPVKRQRSLDAVLTGGAGFYRQGDMTPFQATGNLDFYAQTSILDLAVGAHVGFSDPVMPSISLGLRFPVTETNASGSGTFADAALLFFDKSDTEALQIGLRAALAARYGPANLEYRLAGEIRRLPFGGDRFEAWAGIEFGFFVNLLKEEVSEPTRKDSLRAELRYIAMSEELHQLDESVTDEQIDAWSDRFWSARNITGNVRGNGRPRASGGPRNEAKEEYMRRVMLANERYSTPRRMGVTTDMGRVVLIYGEPDRIESSPSELDPVRRYMLWVYTDRVVGYKTTMFLFLTVVGRSSTGIFANHGEYRQIYSNLPGEPTEGIPNDLQAPMLNFIESFGR